jgi:hypothetical protein
VAIGWDFLRPGMWVAVTEYRKADDVPPWCRRATFDGRPVQVTAMSWPFVAVSDGRDESGVIDFRDWGLTVST